METRIQSRSSYRLTWSKRSTVRYLSSQGTYFWKTRINDVCIYLICFWCPYCREGFYWRVLRGDLQILSSWLKLNFFEFCCACYNPGDLYDAHAVDNGTRFSVSLETPSEVTPCYWCKISTKLLYSVRPSEAWECQSIDCVKVSTAYNPPFWNPGS